MFPMFPVPLCPQTLAPGGQHFPKLSEWTRATETTRQGCLESGRGSAYQHGVVVFDIVDLRFAPVILANGRALTGSPNTKGKAGRAKRWSKTTSSTSVPHLKSASPHEEKSDIQDSADQAPSRVANGINTCGGILFSLFSIYTNS